LEAKAERNGELARPRHILEYYIGMNLGKNRFGEA